MTVWNSLGGLSQQAEVNLKAHTKGNIEIYADKDRLHQVITKFTFKCH